MDKLLCAVLLWSQLVCSHGVNIKFGILFANSSGSEYSFPQTAAALTMAESQLRQDGVLNENVTFTYVFPIIPPSPTEMFYSGKAVEMYMAGVDVVAGPSWSLSATAVGYLCTYWNMPFLNWGAINTNFRNKKKFSTMIRLMADTTAFPKAIQAIFTRYNWSKYAKIMVDRVGGQCAYYDQALNAYIREVGSELHQEEMYYFNDRAEINDANLDKALLDIKFSARIIILCIDNSTAERYVMLRAQKLGMTNGEYVWMTPSNRHYKSLLRPWYEENLPDNDLAKQAYRAVFDITYNANPDTAREEAFLTEFPHRMAEPPWNYRGLLEQGETGSGIAPYMYDVMYLYGLLVNRTIEAGQTDGYRDGNLLQRMANGTIFNGMSGKVFMDELADRRPDFWLWDSHPETGVRTLSLIISMSAATPSIQEVVKPDWNTLLNEAPPDHPVCGFRNEKCPEDLTARNNLIISLVVVFLVVLAFCGGGAYYRRQKQFEDEMNRMLWKIDYPEIQIQNRKAGFGSQLSFYSQGSKGSSLNSHREGYGGQFFTKFGILKGLQVAIKHLHLQKLDLTRDDHYELKVMRDLTHENINQFVGLCAEPPDICTLFNYCSKGSLMDLLENEDIKLDNIFKVSMMQDLCSGLHYLHNSFFKSHGALKSTNCVVDSRWMLKITDFGLPHLMTCSNEEMSDYQKYRKLWWTAPELLRVNPARPRGSQKGDIYSLGLIVYEITFRKSPYSTELLTPRDHVDRVLKMETPPYRPQLEERPFNEHVEKIMVECWREYPDERPDISHIKKSLKRISQGKKLNLMDHMLGMMEKYANNLEELVESRTKELFNEKKKTDMLLYRMLPAMVADRLKIGESVAPESFDEVTIYFSDIIGFTTISAASTPFQVVDLLNDLYTMFDNCIDRFDVYKVETIGDAYMVASGLPLRNGNRHAGEIADMALDLLDAVLSFQVRHMPEVLLMIRIGLHTGPCCAGVVGLSMPRYCLFGDTVNMASRMESNGQGLRVHISEKCEKALSRLHGYQTELRGELEIKGKGKQITHWLVGKEGHTKRLPNESELNPVIREDGLPVRGSH